MKILIVEPYFTGSHKQWAEGYKKYSKHKLDLTFTPHLSPMFRGIFSTIYVDLKNGKTISNLHNELVKYYKHYLKLKCSILLFKILLNDIF